MTTEQLNVQKLSFETQIAKICALTFWVQKHIEMKEGRIVAAIDFFQLYKKDTTYLYSFSVVMQERTFYKEFQNALLANKIIFGRIRYEGKRSFSGINYT